jgi:hypothetical protein
VGDLFPRKHKDFKGKSLIPCGSAAGIFYFSWVFGCQTQKRLPRGKMAEACACLPVSDTRGHQTTGQLWVKSSLQGEVVDSPEA